MVQAHVLADPAQPSLPVQVQMAGSGGSWTSLASGTISEAGTFDATISHVSGGSQSFRAFVGADPANGVLAGYSAAHSITVGGAPSSTPPKPTTPATGSVQFTKIQYNSPGVDTGSTTSLNGEWFRLTNKTSATVDLKLWTVRDAANNTYTFWSSFRLGGGKSVYVHTGKGSNRSTDRYWGRAGHVWDNGGDTATLRTAAGKTIDSCKWKAGSGTTNC